jgi:hypothetical protein
VTGRCIKSPPLKRGAEVAVEAKPPLSAIPLSLFALPAAVGYVNSNAFPLNIDS